MEALNFTKQADPFVLQFCPFVPFNLREEANAFATLLLHVPWPDGAEDGVVPEGSTAVHHLEHLRAQKLLSPFVDKMIADTQRIYADLQNNGVAGRNYEPGGGDDSDDDEEEEEDVFDPGDVAIDENAHVDEAPPQENASAADLADHVIPAASEPAFHALDGYVKKLLAVFEDTSKKENVRPLDNPEAKFEYGNAAAMRAELAKLEKDMNAPVAAMQKAVFERIKAAVHADDGEKLRLILSGQGGTGKTHIIRATILLCRLKYGRTRGKHGPIVVIAPSGCAAYNAGAPFLAAWT